MRISYLTLEAPRNGQASYTHIHEIMNGLERRGWDVTLYQPSYAEKEKSPGLFGRLLHSFCVQIRLWAGYRKGTVIYVRAHYLAFPTAIIAGLFNISIVHEVNGPYEDTFVTHPSLNKFRRLLIWMQKTQYGMASELIAVTENIALWLRKETRSKFPFVIPNGANTDMFQPGIPKPWDVPEKYALFFGGLSRWHGIPDILAAFESSQWPSGTDLVIIGDGAERQSVENAAIQNPRIHYLGKRSYSEIPAYVASSVCGLVPITNPQGRSETGLYPLKLFETLACGIPAIVTDFPGQADLVREGGCGIVIPENAPEELAQAVHRLSENTTERAEMGKRAAELIRGLHSWDKRAEDTNDIIKALQ